MVNQLIYPVDVGLGKRRSRENIIAETLYEAREGILKTQLMYRVNLSFTQIEHYLGFLLEKNFLEKITVSDNPTKKKKYKTTDDKGKKFLEYYNELMSLLK